MKADPRCARVGRELSAWLDGELAPGAAALVEAHIASCRGCTAHAGRVGRARRALRAQPVEEVPDLTGEILARIGRLPARPIDYASTRPAPRSRWSHHSRIAAAAALVAALLLARVSLPLDHRLPQSAAAAEIPGHVAAAARALQAYRASFDIVERGWRPDVAVRRFTARVAFEAPESFRLTLRDETSYRRPDLWPQNNVDVVANPRRWWMREPSSCPSAALPGCAIPSTVVTRAVVDRQPFDGASSLPTDIVIPLETLSSGNDLEVLGDATVLGRTTTRVALPYHQAAPLVGALEAGGSWRGFSPFDRVEIWIDRRTWFPLRFEVHRGSRALLKVRATSFSEPDHLPRALFRAPQAGEVVRAGFTPRPFAALAGVAPSYVANLLPYRAGMTEQGQKVLSYVRGMTWMKVITESRGRASPPYDGGAEELRLPDGRVVLYQPATDVPGPGSLERRVDVYGRTVHVHLEGNLDRAKLIEVAASLPVRGRPIPRIRREGGLVVKRVTVADASAIPFAREPRFLVTGYRPVAAFLAHSRHGPRTVTMFFRRREADFDGLGIRVTQSRGVHQLPPSSETFRAVGIGRLSGRWSSERGELEWIDHGTYRAVAAPAFGMATALRIARSLR